MERSLTHIFFRQLRSALVSKQVTTYAIYKKLVFYRFNDRGAHLLTVDIGEQPNYLFLAPGQNRHSAGKSEAVVAYSADQSLGCF